MSAIRIAVTGAGGQIAYSLLFRIAHGDLFGLSQEIEISLLDLPGNEGVLEAVKMELEDGAFPLVKSISTATDPEKAFEGADWLLLVGAKPRSLGMERKDLLKENAAIFIEQGKAAEKSASTSAKVVVVGNPCNTNAWIFQKMLYRLDKKNVFAMTRLDENRARAQIALRAKSSVKDIRKVCIWGNHSNTQVPDYIHALVKGRPVKDVLPLEWLQTDFFTTIQNRGADIIKKRGKSSAASAASALVDTVRALRFKSKDWFSIALSSKGNPYGIDEDLIFSFPCTLYPEGPKIVADLSWDSFLEEKIKLTEKELQEEREMVSSFL